MRKKSSSHKKNYKSLLSSTIEQIKRDLKGEYNEFHESPVNNNINWNQKIINKKKYNNNIKLESEKTNDENINENIIYNNNFNKKKLNINTNNPNYNSKNKYINNYQLSSENNKNNINLKKNSNESILQKQIRDLKIKSQNMKDKLIIFLKLMKKYSFKLTTLTKSNSRNNNSKEKKSIINNEIKSTLSQLNKMLNNPKLNEDIFDLQDISMNNMNNNLTTNNDEMLNLTNQLYTNYNLLTTISNNKNEEEMNTNIINSKIITTEVNIAENENEDIKNIKNEYMKDIEGLIDKYEEKINLLKNENNTLKKNNMEKNNYVNSLVFQISELKDLLQKEKKDYEQNLIRLNNDSISLQKKVDILQDENLTLKKNCVELSQNLSKINYSEKNDINIEKELQHKNNIIKYLENLLKNSGINFNSNYNYILNNKNENSIKFSKTKNDFDINDNDKMDELSKQYFTFYNMNPKSISINTSKNIDIKDIKSSKESNLFSPIVLQQEIDDIDKEIVDLQKQLKQLLDE